MAPGGTPRRRRTRRFIPQPFQSLTKSSRLPPGLVLPQAPANGSPRFIMQTATNGNKPAALAMLASERPRNVGWLQASGLLFGDWGTSRLYVLGLALFFAGRTSFYLIAAMSGL